MNLYFIFEGKTEEITYKKWLSFLLPEFKEVKNVDEARGNNYFYYSDIGIPDCYSLIATAIQEINIYKNYDYLVLFIDADNLSVDEKLMEAEQFIQEHLQKEAYKNLPKNCQLRIIVQKVCIETWFLGNLKFIKNNPQSELIKSYLEFFDVRKNCPEELVNSIDDKARLIFGDIPKAQIHHKYLRECFKEHTIRKNQSLSYQKTKPIEVIEQYYFNELIKRIEKYPTHLKSFQNFINFIQQIK